MAKRTGMNIRAMASIRERSGEYTCFSVPVMAACCLMMAGKMDLAGNFLAAVESKLARALAASPVFSSVKRNNRGDRTAARTLSI